MYTELMAVLFKKDLTTDLSFFEEKTDNIPQ